MSASKCIACGLVSETLAPSGRCETCNARTGETRQPVSFAPTRTVVGPEGETRSPNGPLGFPWPDRGYQCGRQLGQGGIGMVYQAVLSTTQQVVAVKKLQPGSCTATGLRRFLLEAQAMAKVDHSNVVRLHYFDPDPRDPHLVMELVDGQSLSRRIKEVGRLPPLVAAQMIAAAARGVQAAHDAGVIHRDLKPSNLLVTADDRVKVADFGLGKLLDAADGETVTATGQMAGGTPGYMAPEQVDESLGTPGPAADVWGLGACLYNALTGETPFPGGRANMHWVLSEPLVPPRAKAPAVPPVLDAIVCKCLEKEPGKRYASAASLADDLDAFVAGRSTTARPLPWPTKAWRRARNWPRGVVTAWAVALTVALVAVGISLAMVPKVQPPPDPAAEHARLREQFLTGQPVELVPEKGLPKWHEWVIGKADISDSPSRDGAAYLRPFGLGVVKLFDPPKNSYRVSVDLQHFSAQDEADEDLTWVGLVVCLQRAQGPDGDWADTYVSLGYRDWDVGATRGRGPTPQRVRTNFAWLYATGPGGRYGTGGAPLIGPPFTFTAGLAPPGRWRRLAAEVTPDRLKLFWGDANDGDQGLRLVADRSADEMSGLYAASQKNIGLIAANPPPPMAGAVVANPALFPPNWSASGGCGLFANRSGLAFRNMSVRSIPFPPQE
ncbi:MAG: serine/threonine protein kinase [Fimbriiglobus sp.]|nr:serine/threonine protein kinase [Fimbriiglobus sp.]